MTELEKLNSWVSGLTNPGETFKLETEIGKGNSSIVYKGSHATTGESVAIKVHDREEDRLASIFEEYLVLEAVKMNPRFTNFNGAFRTESQIWFVVELGEISVKALLLYLKTKEKVLPENVVAYILYHTCQALKDLHDMNFLHRDIKASNILICKNGDIKIIDFDLAKKLEDANSTTIGMVGSPCYMAPEVIASESFVDYAYDTRVDVWSLGITAVELGDWEPPKSDIYPPRAIFQTIQHPPPTLRRPASWSSLYNDFILECLEKTADHRPWLPEILEHPFLTKDLERVDDARKVLVELLNSMTTNNETLDPRPIPKEEVTIVSNQIRYGPKGNMAMYRDDLATLFGVNEGKVLNTLEHRFAQGNIYTYLGETLILINPLYEYPIYGPEIAAQYRCRARCDNAPHIFGVADSCYQDMVHHRHTQNIIITGESGSGKSMAAVHLLWHITNMTATKKQMGEEIRQVFALMEAFCHASTRFNSNATRSIKYFELTFTKTGKLSGGILWNYCLENWRVTHAQIRKKESNFHIFYYLIQSLVARTEMSSYQLGQDEAFAYLPPSQSHDPEASVKKFSEVREAFSVLGFPIEYQETITKLLVAVLLLGQIEVTLDREKGGSQISTVEELEKVGLLLDVDAKRLGWTLTNQCLMTHGEAVRHKLEPKEALKIRDALARCLYSHLVDWVVNLVNAKLSVTRILYGDQQSLGILDPPGFESFLEENTFDQFRINMINEQLQFVYNQRIFAHEIEDDAKELNEQITYKFHDNRELLDIVLSKPRGLLHFIDLQTKGITSMASFLDAVKIDLPTKFIQVKNENTFVVTHYSGQVKYDSSTFQERNNCFLSLELVEVMRQSKNPSIVELFRNKMTKSGNLTMNNSGSPIGAPANWRRAVTSNHRSFNTKSSGKYSQSRQMRTSSEVMRSSLLELLQKLCIGSARFVRCIRPNLSAKPLEFDSSMVKFQIRVLGLVESIRICQNGYSGRLKFAEFLNRYKFLAFDYNEKVEGTRDNCRLLLIRLKLEGWALGKTKVLLKYYNEEWLSRLYEYEIHKVVKIQALIRTFLVKRIVKPRLCANRQDQSSNEAEMNGISSTAVKEILRPGNSIASGNVSAEETEVNISSTAVEEISGPETLIPCGNVSDEEEEVDVSPAVVEEISTPETPVRGGDVPNEEAEVNVSSTSIEEILSPEISTAKDAVWNKEPEVIELDSISNAKEVKNRSEFNESSEGSSNLQPCTPPKKPVPASKAKPATVLTQKKTLHSIPEGVNPVVEFIQGAGKGNLAMESITSDKSVDSDAGPFNFKAMLRKTNRNIITESEAQIRSREPVMQIASKANPGPVPAKFKLEPEKMSLPKRKANPCKDEAKNGIESFILIPGLVLTGPVSDL